MKKIILYAFFNIIISPAFGQIDLKNYSTSYAGDPGQKTPMIIVARMDDGMYFLNASTAKYSATHHTFCVSLLTIYATT